MERARDAIEMTSFSIASTFNAKLTLHRFNYTNGMKFSSPLALLICLIFLTSLSPASAQLAPVRRMPFAEHVDKYDNPPAPPQKIETKAKVDLIKEEAGFKIARIHLTTTAAVPGIDAAKFQEIAETAKKNCPVSKVLAAAEISLDAKLV